MRQPIEPIEPQFVAKRVKYDIQQDHERVAVGGQVTPRRLRKEDTPSIPYRSFDAPGGYTVLVGKSAKNNDELTFRIAKKNDLWLHAQGSGGSHVVVPVIKKGEPFPREVIVRAAQLAARHSKQKHSAIVPVIYTLCKYVWKKKGGPPGTVHVKKEKSLMVKL